MTQKIATWMLLGLVLAVPACSQQHGEIRGVVKFKGEPLPGGTIAFHGTNFTITGDIRKDGTYTVTAVPLGTAKISILMPLRINMGRGPVGSSNLPEIPAKFADAQKSGLTCDVTGGTQTHNVDLGS